MTRVAVVGLGGMGSRVARRLLEHGHDVVVWNRTRENAEPLAAAGATVAESPAAAARAAEAVVTMVATPAALRAVTEGADGIAAGAAAELTVIEMSTVGPAAVERLAATLPAGTALIDAPVLGSLSEAEAGTLTVFAGGPEPVVDRWRPLLSELGTVLHVGPLGSGAAAKLVANTTLLGVLGVLGEAVALGEGLNLDLETVLRVLERTPLAAQANRRRPALGGGASPRRFALRLARKDADLITGAAAQAGLELVVAEAVRRIFAAADAAGWGERDYSDILAWIRAPRGVSSAGSL